MTTYTGELTRRAAAPGTDDWTAAALRLCGLALDAGLISLPDLQAAVNGCRTREELTPVLQAILLGAERQGKAATSEHTKGLLWILPAAALLLLVVACGLLVAVLVRSGSGGSSMALLLNLVLSVAASVPLIAILRRTP